MTDLAECIITAHMLYCSDSLFLLLELVRQLFLHFRVLPNFLAPSRANLKERHTSILSCYSRLLPRPLPTFPLLTSTVLVSGEKPSDSLIPRLISSTRKSLGMRLAG